MDFTETKIDIPQEQNIFSSNKKKSSIAHQGLLYDKKSIVAEV